VYFNLSAQLVNVLDQVLAFRSRDHNLAGEREGRHELLFSWIFVLNLQIGNSAITRSTKKESMFKVDTHSCNSSTVQLSFRNFGPVRIKDGLDRAWSTIRTNTREKCFLS